MLFTEPNRFEEMSRLEDWENPKDIGEKEDFDHIRFEIKQTLPDIKELLTEEELTPEMKRCLDKIRAFCNELSEKFKQEFLNLLEHYRNERRQISQKIIDYLLEKNLVLPSFTITYGDRARGLLEEYTLNADIDEQNLLLVFQLPKPLSQFWWKGGANSWGDLSKDVQDTVTEWGHFYRELMPVVWEAQGCHENESGLDFCRINAVGQHDPKKYYYIWEISEWQNLSPDEENKQN